MDVFSYANALSQQVGKRLADSISFIGNKNGYLTFLIKRLLGHLDKKVQYKHQTLHVKKRIVYLVDSADYVFGNRRLKKIMSKPYSDLILMQEGSGVFEYVYGNRKFGNSLALNYIKSLAGKKIILLSLRDYSFLKFIAEQNKIDADLVYNIKILDNLRIFGTPNLYYNAFKRKIAEKILSDISSSKINDISQYNEIRCWRRKCAQF
jgi:hypothetical protein